MQPNDPTTETPTAPAAEEKNPQEALAQLREFLGGLEPEDELVLLDCDGEEHRVRTTLPARRHIKALRLLDELVKEAGAAEEESPLAGRRGMRRIVAGLRRAIHDDKLVDKVGEIFAVAYPTLAEDGDPLERFPLESVLEALVPLFSRLLAKALATAEKAQGPKTTA